MKKALELIKSSLVDNTFVKATFSSPRAKSQELRSIVVVKVKDTTKVKIEFRLQKHNDIKTFDKSSLVNDELERYLTEFKQCHLFAEKEEVQILLNKKLKASIKTRKAPVESSSKNSQGHNHNREKNYFIKDGHPCAFLEAIGVMDKSGRVKSNYYKKFKQINRFIEMVDDLYKNEEFSSFHAVDFGCGKSYLTFALYFYLKEVKGVDCQITGIDLKQEVIDHCNEIANKVGFDGLKFVHGFIHDFQTDKEIDFVVTLHACDTATDDAILFSLKNKAKKMMFVPCCQHELNKQLENNDSQVLLKHGIFRDRMTSLVTDTMRTQLLDICGYKVQTMEFIDLDHTAKNILLRCSKVSRDEKYLEKSLEKYKEFKKQWNINPYLEKELRKLGYLN